MKEGDITVMISATEGKSLLSSSSRLSQHDTPRRCGGRGKASHSRILSLVPPPPRVHSTALKGVGWRRELFAMGAGREMRFRCSSHWRESSKETGNGDVGPVPDMPHGVPKPRGPKPLCPPPAGLILPAHGHAPP